MQSERGRPGSRSWLPVALGVPLVVYVWIAAVGYDGSPLLKGDGYYYVSTVTSLWQDHDLDLENQLPGPAHKHRGHVALDVRGRVVPKHPILMPIISTPFVVLGHERGIVTFNVVTLILILLGMYQLIRRFVFGWVAAVAVGLTGIATPLPHFVWSYSGDPLPAAMAVFGFVQLAWARELDAAGRPAGIWVFLAGGLLGLAFTAKITMVFALLGACLLLPRAWRYWFYFCAGTSGALAAFGVLNSYLFGSPFTIAYSRIAVFSNGTWVLQPPVSYFDQPFVEGLLGQLLDPDVGLLTTSPITLLAYLGLPFLWRRDRAWSYAVGGIGVAMYLFFSKYDLWQVSYHGNRFLLLPIVLGALPLAAGIQGAIDRRSTRRSPRVASTADSGSDLLDDLSWRLPRSES